MKIAEHITNGSMSGFEIEAGKIGNNSVSKYSVVLPYNGILPTCIAGVEGMAVKIMVTVQLQYKAFLLVKVAGSKEPRSYRLEATTQEIESLLWAVIYEKHTDKHGAISYHPRHNNGLNGYTTGYIQAQLTTRQQIRQNPGIMDAEVIASILQCVPADRLQEIIGKSNRNIAK
ncbi:MAG: hypothetical protein HFF76_04160 [Oscillospiraceae bacterium]|jgi:hypothetical protein|nr:hypothetical protein [Oscillospiraceae bacterium]